RRFRVSHLQEDATWEQEASSLINGVVWSGDGRTVAWTQYDGSLVIHTDGSPERRVSMPDGANAWALTFTDGDRAIVCSATGSFGTDKLLVVDVETGKLRTSVPHRGAAYSLAVNPDCRYLACAGDEEIRVLDMTGLHSGDHRVVRAMMPDIARFLPDGRLLLATGGLDMVRVVDLNRSTVERELAGHMGGV